MLAFQLKHGESKVLLTDTEHSGVMEAALKILEEQGLPRSAPRQAGRRRRRRGAGREGGKGGWVLSVRYRTHSPRALQRFVIESSQTDPC